MQDNAPPATEPRLAILIGAGASQGSGDMLHKGPPLGSALYDELVANFPLTWGTHTKKFVRSFRTNFESGMQAFWDEGSEFRADLLIDMGRYFRGFSAVRRFGPYTPFLEALRSSGLASGTTVASLNYETLLEEASLRVGLPPNYRAAATTGLLVLKPHGSWNFAADTGAALIRGMRFIGGDNMHAGPVKIVNPLTAEYEWHSGIPPVMSLYAASKHSPAGADFIADTRRAWADKVAEASVIITIGVHPNLRDEHIWQPILRANAPIWYVGGTWPAEPYDDFKELAGDRLDHLAEYFKDANPMLAERLGALAPAPQMVLHPSSASAGPRDDGA